MTYKLKNKIDDLLSFKISENDLIYVLKISSSLFLNGEILDTNIQQDGYSSICSKIIYSKGNNIYKDGTFLSQKSFLIQQNHSNCKGIIVLGEYEIQNNTINGEYEYLDLNSGFSSQICKLQNVRKIFLQNTQVYFATKKDIQSFSISEFGKKFWQFSLESLGTYRNFTNEVMPYEVIKFIGEHEGTLIVQLTNATLLFLDITTGKTEKIIHLNIELPILPTCHYDDSFPPHLVGDQLLWLNNQRYFTINLNTYEIKVVRDYFKEPKENQFRFMSNTYFEGKLYFVADIGWQYVVPTRIGVMDAETGEVLWQQQLHKTGGLPEPPQVTQDKLFIRTTKGTLYIFENEYA